MPNWEAEPEANLGSYRLETELEAPVPRPVPDKVQTGRYDLRLRKQTQIWCAVGLSCLVLDRMPFAKSLSYNLLPLAYLPFIAILCIAVAVVIAVRRRLRAGRFKYIKCGIPVKIKILTVEKIVRAVYNGVPSSYAFAAVVELEHPETGLPEQRVVLSYDFPSMQKDKLITTLVPGQIATGLYFPRKFDKSLKLYGFLELSPETDFICKKGISRANVENPWISALKIASVCLIFVTLIWNVYALGHFSPIKTQGSLLFVTTIEASIIAFILCLMIMFRIYQRERVQRSQDQVAATSEKPLLTNKNLIRSMQRFDKFRIIMIPLLLSFLVGLTVVNVLFYINACFDTSKPEYKVVKIDQFTQTTYNLIYRTYKIEYFYPGPHDHHSISTTYRHIMSFENELGIIEIHHGFLGWEWVKGITPVKMDEVLQEEPEHPGA